MTGKAAAAAATRPLYTRTLNGKRYARVDQRQRKCVLRAFAVSRLHYKKPVLANSLHRAAVCACVLRRQSLIARTLTHSLLR